jgi:menaquinol-cytochrome c reductase iron-sulfur subunit
MAEQNTTEERRNTADAPRRRLLARLSLALGALAAAVAGIPSFLFLLLPVFKRSPQVWRSVGPVSNFAVGKTVSVTFDDPAPLPWAGVTARTAAWLRRENDQTTVAYAINCTHLGCPVRWLEDANLFLCPCHGGVYYNDGTVAAGPPPAPLYRYQTRIRNGSMEILTSALPIPGVHP